MRVREKLYRVFGLPITYLQIIEFSTHFFSKIPNCSLDKSIVGTLKPVNFNCFTHTVTIVNTKDKKNRISEIDDGSLIYEPPHENLLYEIDEIKELLQSLIGLKIPDELSNVKRSHWTKRKIISELGYEEPDSFRDKKAKKHKPKYIHQVMDIFVHKENNLQIWGEDYVPYADVEIDAEWREKPHKMSEMRIVIVKRNEENIITGFKVVKGEELENWDNTGTKTVKWQGFIPDSLRNEGQVYTGSSEPLFSKLGKSEFTAKEKLEKIRTQEVETSKKLAEKPPETADLVLTIDELESVLKDLIGIELEDRGERLTGQLFEKKVAEKIGYEFDEEDLSADRGEFPDILNQLLEIKFQDSPTIDLGRHLPTDDDELEFEWNDWKLTNQDIRYVIGLGDEKEGYFELTDIVILSGGDFKEFFGVTSGTNSKIQMSIPGFEDIGREEYQVHEDIK